jgi:hypothetical protein
MIKLFKYTFTIYCTLPAHCAIAYDSFYSSEVIRSIVVNITLERTDNYTIQAGNKVIRGYSTRKFNVMLHKMQFKTD